MALLSHWKTILNAHFICQFMHVTVVANLLFNEPGRASQLCYIREDYSTQSAGFTQSTPDGRH